MTYWEGYRDGSRDKEGVIRELGDANERLRSALQCIIALAGEEEGSWEQRMEQISVKAHAAFHARKG